MDALLIRGAHRLGRSGAPEMVFGGKELLQRAAIRLTVRRGSLPHDPHFGCSFFRLRAEGNRAALNACALAAAREALAPLSGVTVSEAECRLDPAAQRLYIRVGLLLAGERWALEVAA